MAIDFASKRRFKNFQVRKNAQQALIYFAERLAWNNQRFHTQTSTSPTVYPQIPSGKHSYVEQRSVSSNPQEWLSGYRNIIPIVKVT